MALTNVQITKAKPAEKPYKLPDSGGLYLQITPAGSKCWRLKYRFLNKEKLLSIGQYPHVSLIEAREARDKAKKLLTAGEDPAHVKQSKKHAAMLEAANTFESVAREWHDKTKVKLVPKTAARRLSLLERAIFPSIGKLSVGTRVS